jgi:hypothetical protein
MTTVEVMLALLVFAMGGLVWHLMRVCSVLQDIHLATRQLMVATEQLRDESRKFNVTFRDKFSLAECPSGEEDPKK